MAAVRYHTESIPGPTTAPKAAAHTVFCFLERPRVSGSGFHFGAYP